MSDAPLPPAPGTVPLPAGHVRILHGGNGTPDGYATEGVSLDHARGSSYGEPNAVWGVVVEEGENSHERSAYMDRDCTVEFHVPADDPMFGVLQNWSGGHARLDRSVSPEEIIAVHQPWHRMYRDLEAGRYKVKRVAEHGNEQQRYAAAEYMRRHPERPALPDLDNSSPAQPRVSERPVKGPGPSR